MKEKFLQVKDLEVIYKTDLETVYAVNNISFDLDKGETLGLVGETAQEKRRRHFPFSACCRSVRRRLQMAALN